MFKRIVFCSVVSSALTVAFFSGPLSAQAPAKPLEGVTLEAPLPRNLWVEMAKKVNPAVVNISTNVMTRPPTGRPGGGPGGRDPFFDMFEEFFGGRGLNMPPRQAQALGTGFLIRQDGYILTNNHVVAEGAIKVTLAGKPDVLYDAKVIGRDVRGDLSLIKITTKARLPYLQLGSSEKIEVGSFVAAFGNPFGHANTMTVGIISAKGRQLGEINRWPFLQTDASINQGNSGGPLLDTEGYVVGVNTAIDARAQGIGFAIPVDYVKNVLPTLYKGGSITRGYLGINIDNMSPMVARQLQVEISEGALIAGIEPGGPAAKGGLREYDIVTGFNEKKVSGAQELTTMVQDTPVGTSVKLKITRIIEPGRIDQKTVTVKVGQHPADAEDRAPKAYAGQKAPFDLGFVVSDPNAQLRREMGIKETRGAVVIEVDGDAAQAGLAVGDVIIDVNKTRVASAKDVLKALKKGPNLLRVSRQGNVLMVVLQAT